MAVRLLLTPNHEVEVIDGTATVPSIRFGADPDTGFIRAGSGEVDFVSNGSAVIRLSNLYILHSDGSAGNPGISWLNDNNTGIYRVGADVMGMVAGGVARGIWRVSGLTLSSNTSHATTVGTNIISLFTGTAPAGTLASGGSLYVATATNVELNYIDSAGNAQQLSTT